MKNSTFQSILTSFIFLSVFAAVNSQVLVDTTYVIEDLTLASGTGQEGGDWKFANFGDAGNSAICNFDDAETQMTPYESWLKFDITPIEESIPEGEKLLYAEIKLSVSNNTGQGFYAYHLRDIDDWKEGDGYGNDNPDESGEGLTWDAAQAYNYENEANYTLVHTDANLTSTDIIFDITSAVEYELGEEGNKFLTLRLSPTITDYLFGDPDIGKRWLGFYTRESPWGLPVGAEFHPAAPHIIFYIGPEQPTVFSDVENFGDIGNYNITPTGFQRWIVGDDEGDTRLIINERPAPISGSPGGIAVYNKESYTDFDISVKAKLNKIKSDALDPKADFVLVFGYKDKMDYSYIRFTGEDINGFYTVDTTDRGTVTEVGDLNTTPAVSDTNYHDYRLVRSGNTVTAYKDGTEYMSVTDDALGAEGMIGMGSYNDIALFDNFEEGGEPGAVNDMYGAKFTIYPNPAGDNLKINAENDIHKLVITNIIGQDILTIRDIRSQSLEINVSNLNGGVYFITVYGNNGRPVTGKFIKK